MIQEIIGELSRRCQCRIEASHITSDGFLCSSPEAVTFRAKLSSTEQATSSELIEHMRDWITTPPGAIFPVKAQTLIVDPNCPIMISSLGDPQCEPSAMSATTSTEATMLSAAPNSSVAATSIGAVVAVVIAVLAALGILIVVLFIVKRRKAANYKPRATK